MDQSGVFLANNKTISDSLASMKAFTSAPLQENISIDENKKSVCNFVKCNINQHDRKQ